jgi:hypothetical protein
MSIPRKSEQYEIAVAHLRGAQEAFALISHLCADEDRHLSAAWLKMSEQMRLIQYKITLLAQGKLH